MLNLPVYLYKPVIRVFIDLENSTKKGVEMMHHGYATISKGLKNKVKFKFLNGDQRAIDVSEKTFVFKMFDPATNNQVLEKSLTVIDDGETLNLRGQSELSLSSEDTLNLSIGNYTYSILLVEGSEYSPTFIDGASSVAGNIYLTDGVSPKFLPSQEVTFLKETGYLGATDKWTAGPVAANKDGKGNNFLHSFQLYFTNFTGNLKILATIDNTATTVNWSEVQDISYTNQNGTLGLNLQNLQNINYFKFEFYPTTGKIDKILFRS
jgi:hypothetical protein